MNEVKYSKKYDVFVCDKNEPIQFCSHDMMTSRRVIAGFMVFRMCFFWLSEKNPLWKIKNETINRA